MIFTPIQKKILNDFKDEEYIRLNDFWKYYSTQASISTAITRLTLAGILIDDYNKFKINHEMLSAYEF